MRSILRPGLSCLALALLAACAADLEPREPAQPAQSLEELARARCRSEADCPQPGAPCRECKNGETVCPEVECVHRRCVYHFPQCEPPYDPCAGQACGDVCTICDPNDPDCVETAVVKYCQPDGSCSPVAPSCPAENPCAAVLCPTGSQCVVLETFPPQAKCVPIDPPDPCAAVRCAAGTHCEAGSCVPDVHVFCGGIAAFPCPGAGSCIDDPSDDCDPNMGGADCGGVCVCNALGSCIQGYHWDGSPDVCGCVADPVSGGPCGSNTCAPGYYCCNASCGICTPKGGACIQIACAATL